MPNFGCTDIGNGERFVHKHGAELRHIEETGQWLKWTGSRWKPVPPSQIWGLAKKVSKSIHNEARDAKEQGETRQLSAWAAQSGNESKLRSMISMASKSEPVSVSMDDFDTNPYWINCQNCVVDLKTGNSVDHDPEMYVSKQARAEYHPHAGCERWSAFLDQIFPNDPELISYMQKCMGYAITGEVGEQRLMIWYGLGANGKTTLAETLISILGDYAKPIDMDLLLSNDKSQVRTLESIGSLKGIRLAVASETESTKSLAVAQVKRITGGETLIGAAMHKGQFHFPPTHQIIMLSNHLPMVKDGSHSIWRRILPVPFGARFTGKDINPRLKDELLSERDGIFAWLVRGAVRYYAEGLGEPPQRVRELSEQYQDSNDVLGRFIRDQLIADPKGEIPAQRLYAVYDGWCGRCMETPVPSNFFPSGLKERGIERKRLTRGMVYLGYRLAGDIPDSYFDPGIGDLGRDGVLEASSVASGSTVSTMWRR